MACPVDEGGIAYVSQLPAISCEGGVVTVTLRCGCTGRSFAMPIWLVRLAHKRMAALLAEQDAKGIGAA